MLKFKILIVFVLFTIAQFTFAQDTLKKVKYTAHNKGKFYIYWGGNRESYSKSDIHFKGDDYDFTLYDVTAHDKPVGWHINYINPTKMTIPQTNFRMGYFFNDHYNISIGLDHMKYVMVDIQGVTIDGYIDLQDPSTQFNGVYNNAPLIIDEDFLQFEHTDGLNYVNLEISRVDNIGDYFKWDSKKIQVNILEAFGAGVLYPKTNSTLFSSVIRIIAVNGAPFFEIKPSRGPILLF